jgi:ribonuclease inhibitor
METILLDFTDCKYIMEIHRVLKESFGLPDYYGNNWDALWDCLKYYYDEPVQVQIKGLFTLPKEYANEIKNMFEIFDEVTKSTPNVEFVIIS